MENIDLSKFFEEAKQNGVELTEEQLAGIAGGDTTFEAPGIVGTVWDNV